MAKFESVSDPACVLHVAGKKWWSAAGMTRFVTSNTAFRVVLANGGPDISSKEAASHRSNPCDSSLLDAKARVS